MKNIKKGKLLAGAALLLAFAVWTVLVRVVDVREIGPNGSPVGFGALNGFFHQLTGVHMALYTVTDLLSILPLGIVLGFALLGLVQWIRRKSLTRVDRGLLALGGFYIATVAVFVFFEVVVINYRPVLINGVPEASYPSSTTMLAACVLPTAIMQLGKYVKHRPLRRTVALLLAVWLLRLHVEIVFGQELRVTAKIGPKKLTLLPKPEKKEKPKKEKKKQHRTFPGSLLAQY